MGEDDSRSLHIRLTPSRRLVLASATLHVGAVACVLVSDLAPGVQWPAVLCLAVLAWRGIALHATGRAARSIVLVVWDGQGRWRLVQRDGQVVDALLERGAYAHPALVALAFRTRHARRLSVLIVPEMADAEALRRLRARLRREASRISRGGGATGVC